MKFGPKLFRSARFWRLLVLVAGAIAVGIYQNLALDVPNAVDGRARVVDGDSLRIQGDDLRLVGIDAPELDQICLRGGREWSCGRAARDALRKLVGRSTLTCDIEGVDRYDRLLAVCSIGDKDINAWLVAQGWAVSYGRYRSEERSADTARRGIWAGEFETPRDWRDRNLRGALAAAAS